MKKQIAVFVFCTIISMATIVGVANSIIIALLMPLIFNAVYAIECVHSNRYSVALTFAINMAFSLIVTKDLFTTFCIIPVLAVSGVLVGNCANKNLGRYVAILGGIISTGGIYTAYVLYSINVLGVNPVMEMFSIMEQTLLSMIAMSEIGLELGLISKYIYMTKNLYVAIMIITFSFVGYLVTYFTAFMLKFFRGGNQLDITFSEFKVDGITMFVYIVTIIASYFVKEGVWAITLTNVYIVLNYYLVICGASIVYYLIKHKMKVPDLVKKLFGLIILSVGFTGLFSIIFVFIALWDGRADFRRLNKFK